MTTTKCNRAWLMAAYKKCGKNFMTPKILAKRVLVSKRIVVEWSEGKGLRGETIYGVTVLAFDDSGERVFPDPNPSQMFHRRAAAESHYRDCV